MFTDSLEEQFFLSHINHNHKVLEYGSGESTVQLSKLSKYVVSVEHQPQWFDKIKNKINNNCNIILKEPNQEYKEGGDCGSYDQFYSYINAPLEFAPYDIILIDGRARIHCAKICHKLGHKDTLIFVHDWHRQEYHIITEYLKLIDVKNTMAKFQLI